MDYPACPHQRDGEHALKICSVLADQTGGLICHVVPATCQVSCKVFGGPHCGRSVSPESEARFAAKMFTMLTGITEKFAGNNQFQARVIRHYLTPVDLVYPWAVWKELKQKLASLLASGRIKKFYLTGSITLRKTCHKDIDVLLVIDDWSQVKNLRPLLPAQIQGTDCEYFFTARSTPHERMCCILDCDGRTLYTSSWFDLQVKSKPDDLKIVRCPSLRLDEFIAQEMRSWISRQRRLAQQPESLSPARLAWQKVRPTWEDAAGFLAAIQSRGWLATLLDVSGISRLRGKRVPPRIYHQRQVSCFGNHPAPACRMLTRYQDRSYCNACGCGDRKLARLDGEGYNKLHYPQLRCPLGRRGFADFKPPLSVLISVLNDGLELNATIRSIRQSAGYDSEVIVIDDASDPPARLDDNEHARLVRLDRRAGAGRGRHLAALLAQSEYILMLDAHMRFAPGWLDRVMPRLASSDNTVWCATCAGLSEKQMDLDKATAFYTGANLVFCRQEGDRHKVFEGEWMKPQAGNDYEIPCLMGACYFMPRQWFLKIGGLKYHRSWGSEEPALSLKTWLAGGQVRLMRDVVVGHKFRDSAPYATPLADIIYNKLRVMKTLLPENVYENLRSKMDHGGGFDAACRLLAEHAQEIDEERMSYQHLFTRDLDWFCRRFDTQLQK